MESTIWIKSSELTLDRFLIIDVFAVGSWMWNKDGTLGNLTWEIKSKRTTEYVIGIDSASGRDRAVKMEV